MWTPQQEAAQDLAQTARAVELIFEAHLENVEILLCYDNPRYDLVLPVPQSHFPEDPLRRGRDSPPGKKGKSAIPGKNQPPL